MIWYKCVLHHRAGHFCLYSTHQTVCHLSPTCMSSLERETFRKCDGVERENLHFISAS